MTPQTIATSLEADIVSGKLPPGTPLSQADLARQFGVSRIPIRDALAQLAAEGLISTTPNRTATVVKLSPVDVEEIYRMRVLLEGDLIARAIPQMTQADHQKIDYALKRSSLDAGQHNWAEGDQMFHAALYTAAASPRQIKLCDDLRRTCRVQIAGYHHLVDQTAQWLRDHENIVAACHDRDPKKAKGLIRQHLTAACQVLLKAMQKASDAES